jgi:hypothetical protein
MLKSEKIGEIMTRAAMVESVEGPTSLCRLAGSYRGDKGGCLTLTCDKARDVIAG